MALTSSGVVAGLLACGGWRDHKNLGSVLAAAAGLTVYTNVQGGSLPANSLVFVLDGQLVSLPTGPATGAINVVINAVPAVNLEVTASVGGPWFVQDSHAFVWSGSAWTFY